MNEEFNTNPGQPDTTLTNEEKENKIEERKKELVEEMKKLVEEMSKVRGTETFKVLRDKLFILIEEYNK